MAKPANELTPMRRQYNEIKEKNQDCILFFRLGDFYEMFDEDARVASRELDLAISNSLGFGGHNACVALRRYVK